MSQYRLFKHKDYDRSAESLPPSIRRKALWAQVLLGTRGRTPSVKGTTGLNARWRRTPVQGNHYYMWWIPKSELGFERRAERTEQQAQSILVHSIRHHDQTDEPIDLGALTDYEEIAIASLDPRYEEQTDVSTRVQQEYVSLATVKGLPGSGKTISLLYLARDLARRHELHKILYITYTSRLKRAAQEFLQAQSDEVARKVRVATLGEIETQLTELPAHHEPFGELANFSDFLDLQSNSLLGPWRRYPQTLFTEIRAHLLGKTFPAGYRLPSQRALELMTYQAGLDATAYANSRGLDYEAAHLACRLAERAQQNFYFQDQKAAYLAIQRLQRGKLPRWLAEIDALVIDEVQDLTLVQIAMLGEIVRERQKQRSDASFAFVVAGDESQIVQPSGFDWGATKDLLGEQVGIWPEEFEFSYQRRSPYNLARLIDNSWNFYGNLPRRLRPSGRRQAFMYETVGNGDVDDGNGQIFLCQPPVLPERRRSSLGLAPSDASVTAWQDLLNELVAKPGRVVVDLSEQLKRTLHPFLSSDDESDEAIFLPREIKGLERTTVILHGLNDLYERAIDLCHNHNNDAIPRFEARRLFDEIRVAISRSTDKLVILEDATAPVLDALELSTISGILPIRWPDLVETLQTEELSAIEVIEGYLDEVDDFTERKMWSQAYRRNRRAYELAVQLDDIALMREAEEQHIHSHLLEAQHWTMTKEWQRAHETLLRTTRLAQDFGDPFLAEEVDDQRLELNLGITDATRAHLDLAIEHLVARRYEQAHQEVISAGNLAKLTADSLLLEEVDEAFAAVAWRWAARLLDQSDQSPAEQTRGPQPEVVARVVHLFDRAAQAMQRQQDGEGFQAIQILAQRYRELPPKARFTEQEVRDLLDRTEHYLAIVGPLKLDEEAYLYARHWLDEAVRTVVGYPSLYFQWVTIAQGMLEVASYPAFDDHLWALESQLAHLTDNGHVPKEDLNIKRFRAFVAVYNETPEEASLLWEELGEITLAIDAARAAGDVERAYQLLRQSKESIPEELAVTVKTIRLLEQLQQKHQGLQPAERETLRQALQNLTAALDTEHSPASDEEW